MKTLIPLAITLLLAACSSQPTSRATYLLRPDTQITSRQKISGNPMYLGTLAVANYIDQPGLVLEQANGKIHTAKHHQWAEPLRVSLRQFLCAEISAEIGYDVALQKPRTPQANRIDVSINQLHGDENGNAVLVAYWSIHTPKGTTEYQSSEQIALQGDGYDALVSAERALLKELAQQIASTTPIR